MPIGATRSGVRTLLSEYGLIVETTIVSDIGATEATLWGELVSLGPYDKADVAFEIDYASESLTSTDRLGAATFDSPTTFSQTVSNLDPETAYQFRAVGTGKGLVLSVSTDPPADVSADAATLRGELEDFEHVSSFDHGDTLEFETKPTLGVKTRLPRDISSDSATLNGELTAYYPDA